MSESSSLVRSPGTCHTDPANPEWIFSLPVAIIKSWPFGLMETSYNDALPQRLRRRRGRRPEHHAVAPSQMSRSAGFDLKDSRADAAKTELDWRDSGYTRSSEASPGFPLQYEFLEHSADTQLHVYHASFRGMLEQACLGVFGLMTDPSTIRLPAGPAHPATESTAADQSADSAENCAKRGILRIRAEAPDVLLLLFKVMDECLYAQSGLGLVAREARVVAMGHPSGALDSMEKPVVAGTATGAETVPVAGEQAAASTSKPTKSASEESESVAPCSSTSTSSSDSSTGQALWWAEVELRGEQLDLSRHPQGTEVKAITFAQMTIVPPSLPGASAAASDESAASAGGPRYGTGAEGAGAAGSLDEAATHRVLGADYAAKPIGSETSSKAAGSGEEGRAGCATDWHAFVVLDI